MRLDRLLENDDLTYGIWSWLDYMGVTNFTINNDLTVDVDGDVKLHNKALRDFGPVKFNKVTR